MSWLESNKARMQRIRDLMDAKAEEKRRHTGIVSEFGKGVAGVFGQLGEQAHDKTMETHRTDEMLRGERELWKPEGVRSQEASLKTQAELDLQRGIYGEDGIMTGYTKREREAKQDWEEKVYLPFQEKIARAGRSTQNVFAGETALKWGEMLEKTYQSWKRESIAMNPDWAIIDENGQPIGYRIPEEAWDQFRQRALADGIPDFLVDSFIESMRYAVETESEEDIPGTPRAGISSTAPEDMPTAMRIGYEALKSVNVPVQLWESIEKLSRFLFDPEYREEEKQKLRELIERLREKAEGMGGSRGGRPRPATPSGQLRQTSEDLQRLREGMHPER